MSTKIYRAFKVSKKHYKSLFELNRDFRIKARAAAQKILYKHCYDRHSANLDNFDQFQWELREKFKQAHISPSTEKYDVGIAVNIFDSHGAYLVIPYTSGEIIKGSLDFLEDFEEYAYWNNTDPPEDVSRREWDNRRNRWNKAIMQWNKARITLEFISFRDVYTLLPNRYILEHIKKFGADSEYHWDNLVISEHEL